MGDSNGKDNGNGNNDDNKNDDLNKDPVEKVYVFQPPAPYQSFEDVADLVQSSLHINSKNYMLPRPKTKNDDEEANPPPFGVKDHLGGQMFVFSFHVMSSKEGLETRCYMYFGGECLRFYPNDIIHIIPELFENPKEVRKELIELINENQAWQAELKLMNKMLRDKEFEKFYSGLLGEKAYPDVTDR